MARARRNDDGDLSDRVRKRIRPSRDIESNVTVLIYGYPKRGKTRLCATAPDVLLMDVNEKGTISTRDINPNVYEVNRWTDVTDLYWWLQAGDHPYRTVAIDGVTALQTLCMNFVLGEMAQLDASRDPDMPSRQAYGKISKLMKTQITNFRNLPMNVVFTALARTRPLGDEEEDTAESIITPDCSPSVANHLEAAVSIIGFLTKREVIVRTKGTKETKKVTRTRLIVDGSERYMVGDRTHTFGGYIDSPNLTTMFAKIEEV